MENEDSQVLTNKWNSEILTVALRSDQASLRGENEEQGWPAGREQHPPFKVRVSAARVFRET